VLEQTGCLVPAFTLHFSRQSGNQGIPDTARGKDLNYHFIILIINFSSYPKNRKGPLFYIQKPAVFVYKKVILDF
jgi:hypothetical protein